MPNYCNNLLIIEGPWNDIESFRENAREEDSVLSLNKFESTGIAKEGLSSFWTKIDACEPTLTKHSKWPRFSEEELKQMKSDIENVLLSSLCDLVINYVNKDLGRLQYEFQTAWSPYNKLTSCVMSSSYPKLTFNLYYAERGVEFLGHRLTRNGETTVIIEECLSPSLDELRQEQEDNSEQDFYEKHFPQYDWCLFYPLWEKSG
jgi:hypothetical protein